MDDVWDACTTPERLKRFFLPVSGDLRTGAMPDDYDGTSYQPTPEILALADRCGAAWGRSWPAPAGDQCGNRRVRVAAAHAGGVERNP